MPRISNLSLCSPEGRRLDPDVVLAGILQENATRPSGQVRCSVTLSYSIEAKTAAKVHAIHHAGSAIRDDRPLLDRQWPNRRGSNRKDL